MILAVAALTLLFRQLTVTLFGGAASLLSDNFAVGCRLAPTILPDGAIRCRLVLTIWPDPASLDNWPSAFLLM